MSLDRLLLLVSLAALSACIGPPPAGPQQPDLTLRLTPATPATRASFDCSGVLPPVHRQICADDTLAQQDRLLIRYLRRQLELLDLPGAMVLEANQQQWQLSLAAHCGLGMDSAVDVRPDADAIACLKSAYRQREEQLRNWPSPPPHATERHPWASYVDVRLVDDRSAGSCAAIGQALNQSVARDGRMSVAYLTGAQLVAGSNAAVSHARVGDQQINVELHVAGLYGGFQQRARGLRLNGQVVMDDRVLPRWVGEQPNYGGRAHASSSQTGDYGSIDVFTYQGQTLALVNESWGYFSPATRGESAYSGVYGLPGDVTPSCLFQTYLTPPRANNLQGLPGYSALQQALDALAGEFLPGYSQEDRRNQTQRWKERQWTLLNLPLLGVDQRLHYGREAAIRARQDAALERFFNWSERNPASKQLYRQVMPMLAPAHQELTAMFSAQGLSAEEAGSAADLLFHETFARTMESLEAPAQPPGLPAAPFTDYNPRYPIAPPAGALEQGRQFATLYSVVLNGAPLPVIRDFADYESANLGAQAGRGADRNTALMAAVADPEALAYLLQRGLAVNEQNLWGKTALMTAAQADSAQSVRLLLEAGADLHAQTRPLSGAGVGGPDRLEASAPRQTALLIAAAKGSAPMIDTLLNAGAAQPLWDGYLTQVCQQLQGNPQLSLQEREGYQRSAMCSNGGA